MAYKGCSLDPFMVTPSHFQCLLKGSKRIVKKLCRYRLATLVINRVELATLTDASRDEINRVVTAVLHGGTSVLIDPLK